METSIVYNNSNITHNEMMVSFALKAKNTIMKKLTNISPFLLLLVPVFMMMILTLTTTSMNNQNDEAALKSSVSKAGIARVNNPLAK